MKRERDSKFELLKIVAMYMIVAHHFVAKNSFNIDMAIIGVTTNKLFLQGIGNHAFIGNNLFFMVSAWFLCDKECEFDLFQIGRKIWRLDRQMLCYSLGLYAAFSIGGGYHSISMLLKSLFPLCTGIWWYPTTYTVFLLLQPFYQKALCCFKKDYLKKMICVMIAIWSCSTVIPFFSFGATNLTGFFMLYAIIFYLKKHGDTLLKSKRLYLGLIIIGYLLGFLSIVAMDLVGKRIPLAGEYACYYIRGNYRILPMLISIGIFIWSTHWQIQSKLVNTVADTTFGIYLIHMYPMVREYLFEVKFPLDAYIDLPQLPFITIGIISLIFASCSLIDLLRKELFVLFGAFYKN